MIKKVKVKHKQNGIPDLCVWFGEIRVKDLGKATHLEFKDTDNDVVYIDPNKPLKPEVIKFKHFENNECTVQYTLYCKDGILTFDSEEDLFEYVRNSDDEIMKDIILGKEHNVEDEENV